MAQFPNIIGKYFGMLSRNLREKTLAGEVGCFVFVFSLLLLLLAKKVIDYDDADESDSFAYCCIVLIMLIK